MQRTVAPAIRVGGRRVARPLRPGRSVRNEASEPVDHHWNTVEKRYPFLQVSNPIHQIALEGSTIEGDAAPTSWAATLTVAQIINLNARADAANRPIFFQQCHAIWVRHRVTREVTGTLPPPAEKASAFDGKSQNRNARKLAADFISWGYRALPGVTGVVFHLGSAEAPRGMWTLVTPAVLRGPDGYLFFGKVNLVDQAPPDFAGISRPDTEDDEMPTLEGPYGNESTETDQNFAADSTTPNGLESDADATASLSEEGLSPEDIQLVIGQVGCTRVAAVRALRQHHGDIVNAIMSLAT